MEQTEDGLYGRKPYLSEVLDVSAFCRGRANIIVAPCHSGKTTATAKIVEAHAQGPERVLYLIDTAAGKKAMINRKQARPITREWVREIDPAWWTGDPEPGKIRVMSYHQFGYELEKSRSFPLGLDLIICDEMHNLIKYMDIEKARNKEREKDGGAEQNCCRKAFECLCQCAVLERDGPLIVILTATPNSLCQALHKAGRVPFECFVYSGKVHADLTRERIYYADLPALLKIMKERCVVYVPTLSMMDDCAEAVADGQRRICCLWSLHNPREMSEEQRVTLDYLLQHERIPEGIDVLIINAAYETSINIRNEDFRTMVIHTSNADVQVQVRGRLRHDIDKLYLYDKEHVHIAHLFPEEFLNTPLTVSQVREIARRMNPKNEKGRVLAWPSIYKLLEKDGMSASTVRVKNKCVWRIDKL